MYKVVLPFQVIWRLLLCLIGLAMSGCSATPFKLWLGPASPETAPTQPAALPARPGGDPSPAAKPQDASNSPDERSPAKWDEKLRAKYA